MSQAATKRLFQIAPARNSIARYALQILPISTNSQSSYSQIARAQIMPLDKAIELFFKLTGVAVWALIVVLIMTSEWWGL